MTGSELAIDTNRAIAVLNNDEAAVRWIQGLTRVFLPVPVVAELRFGALNSGKAAHNNQRIDDFINRSIVLDISAATADIHARLRFTLKKSGKPIPQNDLWIAAICVHHGIPLATADAHFLAVQELVVIRTT